MVLNHVILGMRQCTKIHAQQCAKIKTVFVGFCTQLTVSYNSLNGIPRRGAIPSPISELPLVLVDGSFHSRQKSRDEFYNRLRLANVRRSLKEDKNDRVFLHTLFGSCCNDVSSDLCIDD